MPKQATVCDDAGDDDEIVLAIVFSFFSFEDLGGYKAARVKDEHPGPPMYSITKEQLTFFSRLQFTVPQIAKMLDVSVRTVHRRMRYEHV